MDAERARSFLLALPHVVETMQWGDNLVFWTGDKAIGGKMFALIDLDGGLSHGVACYAAGPERFAELVEREDLFPAPYLARAHWVAAKRWTALRDREWEDALRAAYAIVLEKLPRRTLEVLAMPERAQKQLIAERRVVLAAKAVDEATKKAAKQAVKKKAASRKAR